MSIYQKHLAAAVAIHQKGKLKKAKPLYLALIEDFPNNSESYHLLALLLAQEENYEEAILNFEKAINLNAEAPHYYNNLANAYKAIRKFTAAEDNYKKALLLNASYAEAFNNLGNLYYLQKKYDEALKNFNAAIQIKLDYLSAHFNLGLTFLRLDNLEAAQKQFSNVLALEENHLPAHYHLANIYMKFKKHVNAKYHYLAILNRNPEHLDALNNLGVIYLLENKNQQAIECFSQVLSLDEHNLEARSNIAATFLQFDRYQNAITHYEEYLKSQPEDMEANYNIAVALMAVGQLEQASHHYQKILTQDPKNYSAHTNLGALYLKQECPDKARHHFIKALEQKPDDTTVRYMLAAIDRQQIFTCAPQAYLENLFDSYALQYENHMLQTLHYNAPQQIYKFILALAPTATPNWRILDLGCGTGLMGEIIYPLSQTLVGIDVSQKMLEVAERKQLYKKLYKLEISAGFKLDEDLFDVVLAIEVFNYMGDLSLILQACRQHICHTGYLIFTTEIHAKENYFLQSHARFSHSIEYVKFVLEQNYWCLLRYEKITARFQAGKAVEEIVWIAKPQF